MRAGLPLAICLLLMSAPSAIAQQAEGEPPIRGPILTLNQERLFEESLYGRRLLGEIEAAFQELAAENRRIEAELEDEERRLTELRPTLSPEEFRPLAETFDERVTEIRRTQEGRNRQISRRRDEALQEFLAAAVPILTSILQETDAEIILDARSILLAADRIDITNEALAQIDAVLGADGVEDEGEELPAE